MANQSGGLFLPGVEPDGAGGILAQNFTAYPPIADPTEGPVLTAIDWTVTGDAPLPAGNYEYLICYEDLPGNRTQFMAGDIITLDGTQLVQLAPPPSLPASVQYVGYARRVVSAFFMVTLGTDAGTPYIDTIQDDALVAQNQPVNTYNQTFPTATLGGTTINGTADVMASIAEWGATPQSTQPSLVASRADMQAQIDELVAVLVAKGTLVDNRVP